jgi:hypothetical protein
LILEKEGIAFIQQMSTRSQAIQLDNYHPNSIPRPVVPEV